MKNAFSSDTARAIAGPDWLVDRRSAAAERLADSPWPSSSEEIWRYSLIDDFDIERYQPDAKPAAAETAPGGGPFAAEVGARAGLVVVHNGHVVHTELDDSLAEQGVVLGDIANMGEAVQSRLGSAVNESSDSFTLLHDAFMTGGAGLHVPTGVVITKPVVVVHWSQGDGIASFPRTLLIAEPGAEVTLVERAASAPTAHGILVDAVVELLVDEGAHVRYVGVQEHGPQTWQIALQRAHLSANATLQSSAVALGGAYARLRSESVLQGQGAESDLLAVYFGDDNQMLDFRTLQEHQAPRTRSNLLFKGAVEDRARSVYSGLVHLCPEADKAEAYQTNRNLVLTEGASAESIPNLIIEANDVHCSHASTVGPIDDDQLYYLETRGIPPEDAERLIILGFFDDVFNRLPVTDLVSPLRRSVVDKLERRSS